MFVCSRSFYLSLNEKVFLFQCNCCIETRFSRCSSEEFAGFTVLRRNPPDVGVTSGQKPCTKTIYIVLQTSVGLF